LISICWLIVLHLMASVHWNISAHQHYKLDLIQVRLEVVVVVVVVVMVVVVVAVVVTMMVGVEVGVGVVGMEEGSFDVGEQGFDGLQRYLHY